MSRRVLAILFLPALLAACESVPGPRTPPADVPAPTEDADDARSG